MISPTVVAVCLTANRPDMTRQAIASFRAQTYPAKKLLVWDTSGPRVPHIQVSEMGECEYYVNSPDRLVIGQLRNIVNDYCISREAFAEPDIIVHFDSDDWSHPNRIAEQVPLLQSSGAECVGYNEMLFWRDPELYLASGDARGFTPGEAWLYTNRSATWVLGTSLCYWRKTWERAPFAALNSGEDTEWFNRVKVKAITSTGNPFDAPIKAVASDPRMVARIHAGNAGNVAYWPAEMAKAAHHWRRVPNFDEYCKGVFA